jgi:DNA-binding PadR family transcriptional regulator
MNERCWHEFAGAWKQERRHHHWGGPHGHHCFHGAHGAHGPGGRFFERGGIKFVILDLIKEQPRHGYDLIRELEERSGGFYSPSPGVVYPALQALEDQDLIRSTTEEGGKRIYSITEQGLAYLEEHKEQAGRHRDRMEACFRGGEGWNGMRELGWFTADVARSFKRMAEDPDKLKEIRDVLREAKTKIEEIVAR